MRKKCWSLLVKPWRRKECPPHRDVHFFAFSLAEHAGFAAVKPWFDLHQLHRCEVCGVILYPED